MIRALIALVAVAVVCAAFVTACVVIGARAERPQLRQVGMDELLATPRDEDGDR